MTWLEQPDTKKTRHTEEAFKTKQLIISFFFSSPLLSHFHGNFGLN